MKKIFSKKLLFIITFVLFSLFYCSVFSYGTVTLSTKIADEDYTFTLSDYIVSAPYYAVIQPDKDMSLISVVQCDSPFKIGYLSGRSDPNSAGAFIVGYEINRVNNIGTKNNFKWASFGTTSSVPPQSLFDNLSSCTENNFHLESSSFRQGSIFIGNVLYSNFDVLNYDGNILHKSDLNKFEINLSTTEKTNNPVIAYTNYFDYADAKKYKCYISTDAKNWNLMNYETFNNTSVGSTQFRFNYKILKNDTYYFKLLDTKTNEEKYITIVVANILKNSTNSGFNEYGIPQPFLSYERVNDEFIIKTQNFTLEDIQKYQCLYVKDSDYVSDYSQWQQMSLGSYNNTQLNQTEYYFYIKVPKNSENCIYYFVFYDYNQQKYGSPSSLNCDFTAMNEYVDKVSGVTEKKKTKFEELIDYFKQRFGFLTYPFEFIADLLNRILNINYSDPIIHIPSFNNPINNQKIFDGFDYNFNDLLNNAAIKNIYNIYLIAVDFIIIIGLIIFAYNTILGVFGNG